MSLKRALKEIELFSKNNSKKWNGKKTGATILVEIRDLPSQTLTSGYICGIFMKSFGYQPAALATGDNPKSKKVLSSFGVDNFHNLSFKKISLGRLKIAFFAAIGVFGLFIKFLISGLSFEHFISKAKYQKVLIGDLLYNLYIRNGHHYKNPYSRLDKLFYIAFKAVFYICYMQHKFDLSNVRAVVVTSYSYANLGGIMSRLAVAYHIPLIVTTGTFARRISTLEKLQESVYSIQKKSMESIKSSINWESSVDEYLKNRFSGNIAQHDVINSYCGIKYSKRNLLSKIGLEENDQRPIVFLMPHAFSDACLASGPFLFRDYYQWTIKTLQYIKNIQDVCWIIKPHPSSYLYGEEGFINDLLVDILNGSNMFLCPTDLNTTSVFDVASTIITGRGTIAIEAAAFGINTIMAGEAPWSGYGICYEPKTQEEYFELLNKVPHYQGMNSKLQNKAKQLIHCYLINIHIKSKVIPELRIIPGDLINDKWEEFFHELNKKLTVTSFKDDKFFQKLEKFIVNGNDSIHL